MLTDTKLLPMHINSDQTIAITDASIVPKLIIIIAEMHMPESNWN